MSFGMLAQPQSRATHASNTKIQQSQAQQRTQGRDLARSGAENGPSRRRSDLDHGKTWDVVVVRVLGDHGHPVGDGRGRDPAPLIGILRPIARTDATSTAHASETRSSIGSGSNRRASS